MKNSKLNLAKKTVSTLNNNHYSNINLHFKSGSTTITIVTR
ncbi:hypothetical protein J2Y60_002353 [Arcicella sp. BE140]|nr:hypothetical protein [Arcicella sp. BE140]MDR6562151.1 hypothetical protein [Arcicella sp. BE51]MDR6812154.1 hypothetical protein [Arcicella sp. BE140]MDR6823466.1 hypothetical protein [Arcicella sp. BE139]